MRKTVEGVDGVVVIAEIEATGNLLLMVRNPDDEHVGRGVVLDSEQALALAHVLHVLAD